MPEILIAIWIHFIADFVFQNDDMAINKSERNDWLGLHCFVYALPFLFFGFKVALIAGVSHFIIDYFTSRRSKKLWAEERRHDFFVNIGFDQALHLTVLYFLLG